MLEKMERRTLSPHIHICKQPDERFSRRTDQMRNLSLQKTSSVCVCVDEKRKKKSRDEHVQQRSLITDVRVRGFPCEKNRLCPNIRILSSNLAVRLLPCPLSLPSPSSCRASIFQYPAYFGLLAEIRISISISCRASYFFFFLVCFGLFFSMCRLFATRYQV